jgi:hypothetical protein
MKSSLLTFRMYFFLHSVKLVSLAAQKFVTDIAVETMHLHKHRMTAQAKRNAKVGSLLIS